MGVLHRANLVNASLMFVPLLWSASLSGAELRTTICDRPVCRTVAVVPDATVKRQPVAEEYVTTEPILEGEAGDCASGCTDSCCAPQCDLCCLPVREVWAEFDFLLGWRHGIRTPPLVTTSPNGTPQALAGRTQCRCDGDLSHRAFWRRGSARRSTHGWNLARSLSLLGTGRSVFRAGRCKHAVPLGIRRGPNSGPPLS